MIKSAIVVCLGASVLLNGRVAAQSTASIRGVVRDSGERVMPGVDVVVIPGGRHARTDSTGRFVFESLPAGQYVVRARRFGYTPAEWSADLSKGGQANVQLVFGGRIAALDTVFVVEGRPCEREKFEGFMCRRATAKGMFIDYTDIDTMNVLYSADILRDVGGFQTAVRSTRTGPTRVGSAKQCTIVLMDGIPSPWSTIPEDPYRIIGIEIYKTPREIPKEFQRYTWGKEQCWLVAYWTANFLKPVTKASLPRP